MPSSLCTIDSYIRVTKTSEECWENALEGIRKKEKLKIEHSIGNPVLKNKLLIILVETDLVRVKMESFQNYSFKGFISSCRV